MSRFSGKCDLYDNLFLGRHSTEDELENFKIFKERTDGTLYQWIKIHLTKWNIDTEIAIRNNPHILSKTEHKEVVKDRRCKSGFREVTYYTYNYYGTEYKSLEEINQRGYTSIRKIYFNDILDLIPYYPYIIVTMSCDNTINKDTVFIDSEPYYERHYKELRQSGLDTRYIDRYKELLKEHYLQCYEKYYLNYKEKN